MWWETRDPYNAPAMKSLDLTLKTPEENLALDEALLEACEEGALKGDILRFWESPRPFIVMGYSNKVEKHVNLSSCEKDLIPVLRRVSGGGTVLQGPGSLNYALILDLEKHPDLGGIQKTNCRIMKFHAEALRELRRDIEFKGTTDLSLDDLKFSGNAQRRKRKFCLFHGTFLFNMDLKLIEKYLTLPPDQPDYRQNRSHLDFLINLNVKPEEIKETLKRAWKANGTLEDFPKEQMMKLVGERYSTSEWNFKF